MAASIIFYNGKVLTGAGTDGYEICSAVAVEGDRILQMGSDEDILALADDKTELIDCKGNSVLPGLCDAHCHGSMTGSFFYSCNLLGIDDRKTPDQVAEEIRDRLRAYIAENPDEKMYRGDGFNQFHFTPGRRPSRKDLDAVCSDKPMVLSSFCRHALWLNTKALELAGIDASTPQPESGSFEVEEDGYPTGLFHEMEAIALVAQRLPGYNYDVEDYKKIILRYQNECVLPYGVTLTQECIMNDVAIEAYRQLIEEGKLKMRVRGVYNIDHPDSDEELLAGVSKREEHVFGDQFAINTVKYFLEGFFVMEEPYEEEFNKQSGAPADYAGDLMWSDDVIRRSFVEALTHDLQIHIHAMGDKSVHQAIDSLAYAQGLTGKYLRNTVAHVMILDEEHKKLMGQQKLIASVQPRWMVHDNDVKSYYQYIGQKRAELCYPDRSLSENGVLVAYGTDFPVTPPPNPYHGMQCAVTREVFPDAPDYEPNKGMILGPDGDGSMDWVTISQAICRTAHNGAYQMFLEDVTGSILPGMSAELVLLDRDLLSCPSSEIYSTKVRTTVFKGEIVYKGE